MNWLALDTATSRASVAVGRGSADAVEESLDGARQHARSLIPMVASVLARGGLSLADLAGVLVADGPGSFTGLRVAAAFAKALADTRAGPLRTAPSLLVRAAAAAGEGGAVLVSADALRGERYAAVYRFEGRRVETLVAPIVMPAGALDALAAAHAARVAADAPPDARWLLELLSRDGGTVPVSNVQSWEPVYGRPAEAQAKWEREHGRRLPDPAGASG
jgi:tRNA threonylcarbamoyladenosine biosynthesis protein TsaB